MNKFNKILSIIFLLTLSVSFVHAASNLEILLDKLLTQKTRSSYLRMGKGNETVVTALQQMLNSLGANIKVDGKFGNETFNALQNFQKANNLKYQDGVLGPETAKALKNAIPNKLAQDISKETEQKLPSEIKNDPANYNQDVKDPPPLPPTEDFKNFSPEQLSPTNNDITQEQNYNNSLQETLDDLNNTNKELQKQGDELSNLPDSDEKDALVKEWSDKVDENAEKIKDLEKQIADASKEQQTQKEELKDIQEKLQPEEGGEVTETAGIQGECKIENNKCGPCKRIIAKIAKIQPMPEGQQFYALIPPTETAEAGDRYVQKGKFKPVDEKKCLAKQIIKDPETGKLIPRPNTEVIKVDPAKDKVQQGDIDYVPKK